MHACIHGDDAVQGSPADVAGIRQGDEVVAVDGRSVSDLNPFEVAMLIASAPEPPPEQPGPPAAPAASTADSPSATAGAGFMTTNALPERGADGAAQRGAAAEARAPPGQAASAATASVRLVHEGGSEEEVYVTRGKVAPAANPVSARMARGGRGIVQLQTFNNRAVPAVKVWPHRAPWTCRSDRLPPYPLRRSRSRHAACGPQRAACSTA